MVVMCPSTNWQGLDLKIGILNVGTNVGRMCIGERMVSIHNIDTSIKELTWLVSKLVMNLVK